MAAKGLGNRVNRTNGLGTGESLASFILYRYTIWARMLFISVAAIPAPMQLRGPAEKGR